ncbi:MAG: PPOX class F420-dependent oxidoreductase [Chloroflexi bacterium]|nr:PPOX class F420-dependent oxidoreductase [Chloroflexota bacterium]
MSKLSDQARHFLEEVRFAVLATIGRDGMPQQTVMWYLLRDDEIIMNTARGRLKEKNLRRDPRVSICVADGYRFVTIRGRATLIDDPTIAQADIAALATRYHGPEHAASAIAEFRKQERVTIRVPIEHAYERGF